MVQNVVFWSLGKIVDLSIRMRGFLFRLLFFIWYFYELKMVVKCFERIYGFKMLKIINFLFLNNIFNAEIQKTFQNLKAIILSPEINARLSSLIEIIFWHEGGQIWSTKTCTLLKYLSGYFQMTDNVRKYR